MLRIIRRLVIVMLSLWLIVPTISAFSAGKAYSEGIHLDATETHHQALRITVDAVKQVDGRWRQTQIHISYHYNYVDGSRDFDVTMGVDGDPDQLEVSKDLGWGGLDGVIYVQQRRVDCTFNPSRTCAPEVIETIPVELHLAVGASDGAWQDGGMFKRNANSNTIAGTIQTPNLLTTLSVGQGMASTGYLFSDQAPR